MSKTTETIRTGVSTGQLFGTLVAMKGRLTTPFVFVAEARDAKRHAQDELHELVARARKRLGLTPREAEVLTLLARRSTNREIAAALVISVRTAEHHVAHILRKLGAANRLEAGAIVHDLAQPARSHAARHGAAALRVAA
jgi:DNA-binding NarL/FixJ family response regulator